MQSKLSLTSLLKTDFPIVQGPFGSGNSSLGLASTVSNLGGLGSFGAHYMSPAQLRTLVGELKAATKRSFAVNLWVSNEDPALAEVTEARFNAFKQHLKPIYDSLGVRLPEYENQTSEKFEAQVEAILESRPPVFSFVFGIPSKEILNECRKRQIITIGAAVTVDEAMALDDAGVDAIVASGFEAGGHRVSFLKSAEDSLVGTFSLIPQVVDRVNRPIIAAGGIVDARGVRAALALGASGVQVGSAFLACEESNAVPQHKEVLRSGKLLPTALTRAFSGRLARGIENKMMKQLDKNPEMIAPYPLQGRFLKEFRSAALEKGELDYVSFWAGQSFPQIRHRKAADLMRELISAL